jgi:hypothetical protein
VIIRNMKPKSNNIFPGTGRIKMMRPGNTGCTISVFLSYKKYGAPTKSRLLLTFSATSPTPMNSFYQDVRKSHC